MNKCKNNNKKLAKNETHKGKKNLNQQSIIRQTQETYLCVTGVPKVEEKSRRQNNVGRNSG
jgi:hypothetical protein